MISQPTRWILYLGSGDEGMFQRFKRRTPLLLIEVETAVQEIDEGVELFNLHIIHALCVSHKPRTEISSRFREVEYADDILFGLLACAVEFKRRAHVFYLSGQLVLFNASEIQ